MDHASSSTNRFDGRIAVVTGAGRGIGAATARLLAARGARVALLARSERALHEVARTIDDAHGAGRALAITCDVADEAAVDAAFAEVDAQLGTLDVLVNNAGVIHHAPIESLLAADFDRVLATNLRGTFLCSRAAFRRMSGRGGSIVNLTSLGGIRSTEKFPGYSAYTAAKSGVTGFTEALAAEGRAVGIRVNAVAPGAVDTAMLRQAAPHLRTETGPDDIAEIIAYLCDPLASKALNGAVVEVHSNA